MRRIVLAFDSFKGSLSSAEVAETVSETLRHIDGECTVTVCRLSDGGEGLLASLDDVLQLQTIERTVCGPLLEPVQAHYGWNEQKRLAIIESAQANGLPLVPEARRNPEATSAYGVGELMLDALDRGAKRLMIGLGGSATHEVGLSILQALGARFYDAQRRRLPTMTGGRLSSIAEMDLCGVDPRLSEIEITAACDVNNPLVGPNGAAAVYGPQKGASPEQVRRLDQATLAIARQIASIKRIDLTAMPGAGAAGGIAGSLHALLNARLRPGIDLVLDAQDFDLAIRDADLIITGEGKSDEQTRMGKAPEGVLRRARSVGAPVLLLSGSIDDAEAFRRAGFVDAVAAKPIDQPLELAMMPSIARDNLRRAVLEYFDAA